MADKVPTVAVILTCHNRVNKTLACLSHLFNMPVCDTVKISVYLVDDGSTDGTGESVERNYPTVNVIYADGSLFWNRGMHRAFGAALETGFDYYLWLNDDVYLDQDSLQILLDTHRYLCERGQVTSVIVASTRDPETGGLTYGGYVKTGSWLNPLSFALQPPQEEPIRCDTMCGNCVLIPKQVANIVGNINPEYMHRWGDVDYGLRVSSANCQVWIAPGYFVECEGNVDADIWRDNKLPLLERYKEFHSIKGSGKRDWFLYARNHGGMFWPLVWIRPYLRILFDTFR